MIKQVERNVDGNVYQYVPPTEAPLLDNAYDKIVVQPAPAPAPQPQRIEEEIPQLQPQATYTLEQVKEILDLERQRIRASQK